MAENSKRLRGIEAKRHTLHEKGNRRIARSFQSLYDKMRSQCLPDYASFSELKWRKKK